MVISWNPTADKNETTCWPARNITIHAGVDAVSALVPVMNGTVAFDLWIGSEVGGVGVVPGQSLCSRVPHPLHQCHACGWSGGG